MAKRPRPQRVLEDVVEEVSPSATPAYAMGKMEVSSQCENRMIQVSAVYLLCDSPGAYYYGNGEYRNSQTCAYGDKANLYVELTISSDMSQTGVDVAIYAGIFDRMMEESVIERTDLCGLISVNDDDSASSCPSQGDYIFYTYFTVPSILEDHSFSFTPDVSMKFFAATNGRRIGCASTGTEAHVTNAEVHSQHGQLALGVAIVLFCAVSAFLLYWSYTYKKKLEAAEQYYGYFVQGSKRGQRDFPMNKATAIIRLDSRARSQSILRQKMQEAEQHQTEGPLPAWG